MPQTKAIEIMDLAITDTNPHNSDVVTNKVFDKVAFYLVNGCDQIVDCQLQASGDGGTTWDDIGSAVNVAASGGTDWIINTDPYPLLRIEATAQVSPSSGNMVITANCKA